MARWTLNYSWNTASELGTGGLVMGGGTLNLIGNVSAAVTQLAGGLTLNPGLNAINLQSIRSKPDAVAGSH